MKAWRARECREADQVLVPSDYLRGLVLGWGVDPGRVRVVPNAVRRDARAAALAQLEARRLLGWEDEARVVVAAARLTAWKGIDLAVDAMAKVPGLRLVIAGDGPERASLASRAAALGGAVEFAGALAPSALALHLRAADYVLVYSGYEGLSHTLLEALSLGTPAIASRRGGNGEVVVDGVNGLLVDHPDPAALAVALRRGFEAGVLARLREGAALSPERFGWTRFVEETERVLAEAAGEGRSR